jgi:hypothetical protein
VNITYEYRAVFHQSFLVLRVCGSSDNNAGGTASSIGLEVIETGVGVTGGITLLAAPATFS